MKKTSYHILRIGLAITFILIGVLIFRDPVGWSTFIQPWALKLLPVSPINIMLATATLDVLIGIFLLLNIFTFIAAVVGSLHILNVLIVVGITDVTVRDIGLLGEVLALAIETLPKKISAKIG